MSNHQYPTECKIEVNLRKVAYAYYWFENQAGQKLPDLPSGPTSYGRLVFADKLAAAHSDYPGESEYDRAKRLGLLDVWVPRIEIQFANTHTLVFKGDKATKLWKAYKSVIYGGGSTRKKTV